MAKGKSTTSRRARRPAKKSGKRKKPLYRALLLDLSKRLNLEMSAQSRLADQISSIASDLHKKLSIQSQAGQQTVPYDLLAMQAVVTAALRTLSTEMYSTRQLTDILHEQCGGRQ